MKPTTAQLKARFPESYASDIAKMAEAGRAWLIVHPFLKLKFRHLDPRCMYIGALDEDVIRWFGTDDHSRALLREMDRASEGRATLMQARCALELIFGSKAKA